MSERVSTSVLEYGFRVAAVMLPYSGNRRGDGKEIGRRVAQCGSRLAAVQTRPGSAVRVNDG